MIVYVVWCEKGIEDGHCEWMVKGFTDRHKAEQYAEAAHRWLTDNGMFMPEWDTQTGTYYEHSVKWHDGWEERLERLKLNPFDAEHALSLTGGERTEYSVRELVVD